VNSFNNVVLFGHLTATPQRRSDQLTVGVVAVNHRYKNSEGTLREEVAFVPFVVFGPAANWVAECMKGSPILLTGRLRTERWENDGHPVSRLVLVAEKVHTFPGKSSSQSATQSMGTNGKLPF
jgi:single-strand DNA-binding protein